MKRFIVTSFGLLLAIAAVSPDCWAQEFKFDNGGGDLKFLTAANWNPDGVPDNTLGHQYGINDSFVVTYDTAVTTSVRSLIVSGDVPQTPGNFGTPGTLNMSAGKLIVTGGGDSFQISRACCLGDGLMMMTNAELQIGGSDPIVGTRDHGVLDVGLNAKVYNTPGQDNYWRLGNYGPSDGLEGNGLLNVHNNGTFNAHVIFIGDNGATGELRVSDTGSVILTGNLVARPSGFQAGGAATVRMTGSNATLNAFNLESESLPGEIPTQYTFNADGGGVSEIKLTDAINITNNNLEVNLDGFVLGPLGKITLFDGGPPDINGGRIFGTFANVTVNGVLNPANYSVVYDQPNGDILLQRVPEPSTMVLLGLGIVMAVCAKRRASR